MFVCRCPLTARQSLVRDDTIKLYKGIDYVMWFAGEANAWPWRRREIKMIKTNLYPERRKKGGPKYLEMQTRVSLSSLFWWNCHPVSAISFVAVCKLKMFLFLVTNRSVTRAPSSDRFYAVLEEVGRPECQLSRYSAALYVLRFYNMDTVTLCGTIYEDSDREHFVDTSQIWPEIIAVCIRHHVNAHANH